MRYDATLKKLFQQPPNRLLSLALGKPVTVARLLPTDLITVENLHPDLLFEDADGTLLHAEIHGYQMGDFACRNLIYYGLLLRDYKRHPVQVVFWIGRQRGGVADGLSNPPRLEYSYPVIDVREVDAGYLLEGSAIGEAIFAILCKFDDERAVIGEILRRIGELPLSERREAMAELLVLSGLRGLTVAVREEAARMPVSIDLHENEFLEGIYREGLEKGLHEGKEKGQLQTAREILAESLEEKFGVIPDEFRGLIGQAKLEEAVAWRRRIRTSQTLDEVFSRR